MLIPLLRTWKLLLCVTAEVQVWMFCRLFVRCHIEKIIEDASCLYITFVFSRAARHAGNFASATRTALWALLSGRSLSKLLFQKTAKLLWVSCDVLHAIPVFSFRPINYILSWCVCQVEDMVSEIKWAFEDSLKTVGWMDPETKKAAKEKVGTDNTIPNVFHHFCPQGWILLKSTPI